MTVEGIVEHGRRIGHALGFPTANIPVAQDVAIEDGVYRARVEIDGIAYRAMVNVGRNPSVGGAERHLETHLFDFECDLYGRRIKVELLEKIRGERHFASLEELRAQIEKDKELILKLK